MISKNVWVGWLSSLVEAYNMAIYSFVAPFLAQLIFQNHAEKNAVFFSYSLILLGCCLFYPLGAFYYGFVGDKKGRQKTCVYATLGLGLATGLMGLVPMGDKSWVCFLILICAQHFFSGGEYHGSIVFSLEHAERKQNGFLSALSCLFAVLGLVSANGLATLFIGNTQGIRLCFLMGALGGLISYILKNHCQETPAFIALSRHSTEGLLWSTFLKSEWKKISAVVGVLAFFMVSYTFIFIFLPLAYPDQTTHFDTFKSLITYGFLLIVAGWIADRVGTQKIMQTGLLTFSFTLIPACYVCPDLFYLQMILTISASLVIGPIHGWMLNQFEVQNRCRGIFMSSAIAISIFGGSTVPICLMIFEKTHSLSLCGVYPLIIALLACGCLVSRQPIKRKAL